MESIYHHAANERRSKYKQVVAAQRYGAGCIAARVEVAWMRVICRMNSVVCSVVLNDLGLRFNVPCATVPQKGQAVKVDILEVVPDCLRIKAVMFGEWKAEGDVEFAKVL